MGMVKGRFYCRDRNHNIVGDVYFVGRDAIEAARKDPTVEYVERLDDGLVIARRSLVINPIWEEEELFGRTL